MYQKAVIRKSAKVGTEEKKVFKLMYECFSQKSINSHKLMGNAKRCCVLDINIQVSSVPRKKSERLWAREKKGKAWI